MVAAGLQFLGVSERANRRSTYAPRRMTGERRRRLSSRPNCCPSVSAGLAALSQVNFEVARDEIRAIIGPNGAGKSTFFNCLTGVLRPTSGRIIFNGEDITGLRSNADLAKGIARSYQITNILPNATALENVRIAAQSRRHAWNMVSHHSTFADINEKAESALALGRLARQGR